MQLSATVLASFLVVAGLVATAAGLRFEATNNATTTPGGQRFDREYGVGLAVQVLSEASCFVWKIFNQTAPADRRPAVDDRVKFVVNFVNTNILAFERDSESSITLNAGYVNNITGDVPDVGDGAAVPRGDARVAVGAAGHELDPQLDLRGDRRLRPPACGLCGALLAAARAGEQLGHGLRRHCVVPELLRRAEAGVRGGAQREAQGRLPRRLLRGDHGQARAGAVEGLQGQVRRLAHPSM
uniref:Uncharacterized protein n=1 Tax=Avena sativa TaxID=4498 RepID=A0ACD5ULV7_AVESA